MYRIVQRPESIRGGMTQLVAWGRNGTGGIVTGYDTIRCGLSLEAPGLGMGWLGMSDWHGWTRIELSVARCWHGALETGCQNGANVDRNVTRVGMVWVGLSNGLARLVRVEMGRIVKSVRAERACSRWRGQSLGLPRKEWVCQTM